jgi:hypothetical protein
MAKHIVNSHHGQSHQYENPPRVHKRHFVDLYYFRILKKPPSSPFVRYTLENDQSNTFLHQMIGTESNSKLMRHECSNSK